MNDRELITVKAPPPVLWMLVCGNGEFTYEGKSYPRLPDDLTRLVLGSILCEKLKADGCRDYVTVNRTLESWAKLHKAGKPLPVVPLTIEEAMNLRN